MASTTPADRLALALCPHRQLCQIPKRDCLNYCLQDSAAVAHELAAILRERHASSATADWLDGVGTHP
jgi:hypothetical protein